jgi:PKD repeat protein
VATHAYEDDGLRALLADFDINLTLTDDDTGSDSETITVQVDNVAPSLGSVSISDPINESDTATLTGSIVEVSPADSLTLTVAWGDGAVDSFADGAGTTSFNESHAYADDNPTATPTDVYTVTLTLVDDNGGTAVHMTNLTIYNVAPVVDAGTDMAVNTGTAVTFNGSFSDIGIEETHTIEWDFGDGNTASGTLTPEHTYTDSGVYTATLTVTDDDTGVSSDQVVMTVSGSTIFLPIIMNNRGAAAGPDLVVSSLTAVGSNIEVVITNQGNTAVTNDFWVDVYIDPDPVPTMVNQTWQLVADQGLVWGVSTITLNPGQSLTLTINGAHYRPELSDFTGPCPSALPFTPR